MKTNYRATFSNGATITRSSETSTYTHAWAAFDETDSLVTRFCAVKGFSRSAVDAEKAARACSNRHHGKFRVEVVAAEVL